MFGPEYSNACRRPGREYSEAMYTLTYIVHTMYSSTARGQRNGPDRSPPIGREESGRRGVERGGEGRSPRRRAGGRKQKRTGNQPNPLLDHRRPQPVLGGQLPEYCTSISVHGSTLLSARRTESSAALSEVLGHFWLCRGPIVQRFMPRCAKSALDEEPC